MAVKSVTMYLLLCVVCLLGYGSNGAFIGDNSFEEQLKEHSRAKRSLGGGGESCMSIYTVPKRSLLCEPSLEVQGELKTFKQSLETQVTAVEALTTRLDAIDPNQPRNLPMEVRERLEQIVAVRETQAGHTSAFVRVDTQRRHLSDRIDRLESADRQQVARLIEEQTHLIKVTLHQSNMTLHEEYLNRLTESTRELTDKLEQLEDNVHTEIQDMTRDLRDLSQSSLSTTRDQLTHRIAAVEDKLTTDEQSLSTYQVKTDENKGEVEDLFELLTTLREHQSLYEQDKEQLREFINHLKSNLSQEIKRSSQLSDQVVRINASLTNSQAVFEQFRKDLNFSHSMTDMLDNDLHHLQRRLDEKDHLLPRTLKVGDCQDALAYYHPTSGIYPLNPNQVGEPFNAYCDMEDGHGWTLLSKRQDGTTDFYRDWKAYKNGFGDLDDEHWLGLEKIHSMTSRKPYKLRVDLQDWSKKWSYAEYDNFRVDAEETGYKLHVSGYHGDAGDAMQFHNKMGFSTFDRSYDKNDGICARWCHGGWWYRDCFHSNLNGRYYQIGAYSTKTGWGDGVVWRQLKGTNFYSMKAVIMKITPIVITPITDNSEESEDTGDM